jgi:hypothetical protein
MLEKTTFSDFLDFIDLSPTKPELAEFKQRARILYDTKIGSSVADFQARIGNKKPNDPRIINSDEWWAGLYGMFVARREEFLYDFFQKHFHVDSAPSEFDYSYNIITDTQINGKYQNQTSKILKNLYFKTAYTTKKNSEDDHLDFLGIVKKLVTTYEIRHSLLIPMSYEAIVTQTYSRVFAILRGTTNRPSFFNPWTCGYLLNNLFVGKKLLTPVLDWSSYALGFLNSDWDEYVGIDVMPTVVTKTKDILTSSNLLNGRAVDLYCQPSEEVLKSSAWLEKYENHFDLVFFSPPYWTLELYSEGGDAQSTAKYKSYTEWLTEYWLGTVAGCWQSMAPDSIFAFVISDFKGNNISQDMLEIAQRWFTHLDTYSLHWNSFNVLDAKKMQSGNSENLFVLKKGNGIIKKEKKFQLF